MTYDTGDSGDGVIVARDVGANLLFVEDDPLIRRALVARLRGAGHRVREAETVAGAKEALAGGSFDAVLVDFRLPDGTGFDVLAEVGQRQPGVPTLVLTAHASVELAVDAMRRGAFTYLQKPVDADALEVHLGKALETADLRRENVRLRRLVEPGLGAEAILGTSQAAEELREQVRRVARSPARAILLEGESGTGKGLVARAIHEESPRARHPFVAITCSAMPEALLESELFGHESGAFTDARKRKMGLVEAAEGGTLFLDEIGDMAGPLQAKLLGVLEERRFRRVGGVQETEVNVRVISATHRDLRAFVAEGRFREDLLYRLRVVPIRIPPLRERREDVGVLARRFLEAIAAEWGRPALRLGPSAVAALERRAWPGNVRELRNAVERAVILARADELSAADFPEEVQGTSRTVLPSAGCRVEEVIDDLVRQALERCEGNQSAAARLLGMTRDQVRYRMQRMGLAKGTESA
jgi:DNA-binding NtrC family response regulator